MNYYITLALILFLYMNLWFFFALTKRRNDVADVAWGLGFVLLAWSSFFLSGDYGARSIIVNILVSVWGIRLAWHIHSRNKSKKEDYRYSAWRKKWGKWFYVRSYTQIYLLQGFLLFVVSSPILIINISLPYPLGWIDYLGIAVWLFGFFFETLGDYQLKGFTSDPSNKGKLMQRGLWSTTRHPNYFGEVVLWWGLGLLALTVPGGWIALIGPITISFLIIRVSGIPMLEKKMASNPEFKDYKRRVSIFLPLPPKK